ncbi:hypothetical protein GB937_006144, partial [Aspergillus fischeri]
RGQPDHIFGHQAEIEKLADSLASNDKPPHGFCASSDILLTWCHRLIELERQAELMVEALVFLQKWLRWGRYALN